VAEFPRRRVDDLVMTRTLGDIIVYDERSKGIHTLNAGMADVWEACDGTNSDAHIALLTGLTPTLVNDALVKLSQAGLLETPWGSGAPRQSRRRLLKQAGAGIAVAVPTIISVTAPAAAWNASCGSTVLTYGDSCAATPLCCSAGLQCCTAPISGGVAICYDGCP
jgi:hypothetical protein